MSADTEIIVTEILGSLNVNPIILLHYTVYIFSLFLCVYCLKLLTVAALLMQSTNIFILFIIITITLLIHGNLDFLS
jgi:hypothetical protein